MPRPVRQLALTAVAALATALGACSQAPSTSTPAVVRLDTTWYISARARENGRDTKQLSDSLEFGLIITAPSRSKDPVTGRNLPFRLVDSLPLTRATFISTLRTRAFAEDANGFAVLYTHGFGTSLHESWEQAVHARARSQGSQPWVTFNWPASDNWVTWPEHGEVLATAYRQDSASAHASRAAFLRAFSAVREAVGSPGLVLFTHSMGVQVVGEAIVADDALRAALTADPLRSVAFYAPDVEVTRFGDVVVPAFLPLTRRLVLYASGTDRALAMAKRFSNTDRAGQVQSRDGTPLRRPGLESIDVTEATTALGFLRRWFGTRHGVRHASAALFDLINIVAGGFAPECRVQLGTATLIAVDSWKLSSTVLPTPSAVGRCAAQRTEGLEAPTVDGNTIATTAWDVIASSAVAAYVTVSR